ncbi:MAG: TVP38/TMEM64 family protein [Candidatus Omnitrophica bacterium]|nr:TVP38/TMEM64 family protein [Candidatus Omnitrophota bacterium]
MNRPAEDHVHHSIWNAQLVLGVLVFVVILGLGIYHRQQFEEILETFQEWVERAGAIGVIAFILVYALMTVLFVPGWFFTVVAGVAYGVVAGSLFASLASTLGATAAFLMARTFFRNSVEKWVEGNPTFHSIDRAIGKSGWRMVLLLRLSPIFPFNVLNYALGLTSITPFQYALASWVGMLPGTILYVYLGSIGESFALEGEWNQGQLALFGAGLVATILITVKATQIVRGSMKETGQKA